MGTFLLDQFAIGIVVINLGFHFLKGLTVLGEVSLYLFIYLDNVPYPVIDHINCLMPSVLLNLLVLLFYILPVSWVHNLLNWHFITF